MPNLLKQDHIFTLADLVSDPFIPQTKRAKIVEIKNWLSDVFALEFVSAASILPDRAIKVMVRYEDGEVDLAFYEPMLKKWFEYNSCLDCRSKVIEWAEVPQINTKK